MPKPQIITREKLTQIAGIFLNFLEKEEIKSINNLEKKLGESFSVERNDDIIQIESRPSEAGTWAYTITYIIFDEGIPIEIRMNPNLNYSKIIVKTKDKLKEYVPFIYDHFKNIIQDKTIKGCDISEIKKELENLAS